MEKTKIVKFTPSIFSHSALHITVTERSPLETNVIKLLGFQIDSQLPWKPHVNYQLPWKPHVNYLLHGLSSVCYIMSRLSHVLNVQTLRTVYFTHFHSLVNYGITFWASTSSLPRYC